MPTKIKDHNNNYHYSRAKTLCLAIMLICLAAFFLSYAKGWHDAQVFTFGAFSISGLIVTALNPINDK